MRRAYKLHFCSNHLCSVQDGISVLGKAHNMHLTPPTFDQKQYYNTIVKTNVRNLVGNKVDQCLCTFAGRI